MRIGFLGTGFIATYHSKQLRRAVREGAAEVTWAGAHDPDTAKLDAFCRASGAPALSSPAAVVEASDAVYVCSWTSEHPRLVAEVVGAGRAVFCEKPLAVDLGTAEALVADVQRAGVVNQVGLVLRDSPALTHLRQLVQDPASGRVMAVVFRDDQYLPVQGQYASTWRADPARAGSGTLLEHSIHDLDVLEWLVGPAAGISARTAAFHGLDGIEDLAVATLTWEAGTVATLTSVWHDVLARPSLRRIEVLCEHAHLVAEDDWFGPVSWTTDEGSGSVQGEALVRAAGLEAPFGPNPDAAFVQAVAEGRPARPDVAAALRAHRLADAAYRSASSGGVPVAVSPDPR